MLPGFERGDGQFGMGVRRRTDIHELNGGIAQQVGEVSIWLHSCHVESERFGRADVAGDA